MPRSLAAICFFTTLISAGFAQPVVNAVENNYSYVPPGLPNYGIAQGSIFVVFGSNLAAASTGLQGLPLKTAIDGVSVQFAVQGTTTQALLYYVMPNQIAGVLPSNTPMGTGTVVVVSNGQSSVPAPVTVVQSAMGILTGGGLGRSQAIAFDANWALLGPSNSATPGDVVVVYGSGVGPVSGDESVQQIPQNLSDIPLEVDIGGLPASVNYHGRSIYPGLDQINVVIPAGALGCSVSVVARSGDIVSNIAFIPVAAGSRVCSDQIPGVSFGPSQVLTGKSSYNTAHLTLHNNLVSTPAISSFSAVTHEFTTAAGVFMQTPLSSSGDLILAGGAVFPSLGNCIVDTFSLPTPNQARTPLSPATDQQPTLLNAGPAINFSGPNGRVSAQFQAFQPGTYAGIAETTGSNAPFLIPSAGGSFTIDNGAGGPDVGPFSTQIIVPPPLVWSNMNSTTVVDRSQGLTIEWAGGDPSGYVYITANSSVTTQQQVYGAQLNCSAPVAAHQFTIPPSALLALPPQSVPASISGTVSSTSGLQVTNESNFLFSAPGLDGGLITASSINNSTVPYR